MKHLIKHLWKNNQEEIVSKSFLHCHVKNVHSIMFIDTPEKPIRLYISDLRNELFYNYPDNYKLRKMTTAFHPHHCALTLHCIKGDFMNWIVEESAEGLSATKYLYHSQITEGQAKFEKQGDVFLKTLHHRLVNAGESLEMKATDIHTIACAPDAITAWFVYEGKENKDYQPLCWSNNELDNETLSGMYQKPTALDIERLLNSVGLI